MPAPTPAPTWSTDANYTTGPVSGTPTKVAPSAGIQAEGHVPGTPGMAQRMNWWKNLVGQWVAWLESERAALRALALAFPLANWLIRAHATTSTPTLARRVATRAWVSELDHYMAIFDSAGGGLAQRSPDGVTWTDLSGTLTGTLNDICYMGGTPNKWLIAANTGAIYYHLANTGGAWTATGPGAGDHFRAIASNAAGTLAVAVGDNGRIYSSTNGTAWTDRSTGAAHLYAVAVSPGGRWVAVGSGGAVLTSTDAITWSTLATGGADFSHAVFDAANDVFVIVRTTGGTRQVTGAGVVTGVIGAIGSAAGAIATDGAGVVLVVTGGVATQRSLDGGATWTTATLLTQGTSVLTAFTGLAWNDTLGCYLAVGEDGAAGAPILAQSLRVR